MGRAEAPGTNAYLERLISNYLAPGAAESAFPSSESSGYGLTVKVRGHFSNPSVDPPAAGNSEYRGYGGYGTGAERPGAWAEPRKMSGSFSAKDRDVSAGGEVRLVTAERTLYGGERLPASPGALPAHPERVVLNPERIVLTHDRERVVLNPERVVSRTERIVLTGGSGSAMGVGGSPEGVEGLRGGGAEGLEEGGEVEVSIHGVGVYRGSVVGGQMQGFGELRDERGRLVYRGWFEGGEFSGVGELFNPDASASPPVDDFKTFDLQRLLPWWQRYEGHFKNSAFEGVGQVFFPYKCSFLGEFLAGEATGMGVAIMPKKRVAGRWRANKLLEKL